MRIPYDECFDGLLGVLLKLANFSSSSAPVLRATLRGRQAGRLGVLFARPKRFPQFCEWFE